MQQIVGERFRLAHQIGSDVFGEIYAAVDERDGAAVRVRALDSSWGVAPGSSTAVLAIARGPAAIRHPRVAALLEVILEGDRWYLVSEDCPGETLAARVAREGPVDEATALGIASEVAEALSAIHAAGAVHGRLDPSRIIIGDSVKVCDLGLGMLLGDDSEEWRTTIRDVDDPAVAFLSPEQARGDGPPTVESDVWALAAVLHFAITGSSPYSARTRAAQASATNVVDTTGLESRLAALLRASLAPEKGVRPSVSELSARLRARPAPSQWPRTALAVLAALLIVAGVALTRRERPALASARAVETTAPESAVTDSAPSFEPMQVAPVAPTVTASATAKRPALRFKPARDPFYGVTSAGF